MSPENVVARATAAICLIIRQHGTWEDVLNNEHVQAAIAIGLDIELIKEAWI